MGAGSDPAALPLTIPEPGAPGHAPRPECAMLGFMRCQRAIIQYRDGRPEAYSLVLDGTGKPASAASANERETTFKEAYALFPAIRKRWKPDGTAKE